MKYLLCMSLVSLVALFAGCGGEQAVFKGADTLCKEHFDNGADYMEQKYQGERIRLHGVVMKIAKAYNNQAGIWIDGNAGSSEPHVLLFMRTGSQIPDSVSVGQSIEGTGRYWGINSYDEIEIHDFQIR